jgi:ABC-2 type transport system ATP-binding protein
MEPVISVAHLEKRYGDVVAVADVSFEVARGEVFGILGPNGAGKTTIVECLQGLRTIDGGEVRVLGLDPGRDADRLRRRIGSQLQESALPERIKVWEALDLFSSLTAGGRDWLEVMLEWGLAEKRTAPFGALSGGQQQRLFVALALVNDPEVVFLDEMTTGLDPAARRVAWDLIRRIRDRGTTVVLVTHFMDEAEALCDRVAIVDGKRVVDLDTPERLIVRHGAGVRVTFTTSRDDMEWLHQVRGVTAVERHGATVTVTGTGPVVTLVAASLVERGEVPEDLRVEQPTLEDVFLALTGGEE